MKKTSFLVLMCSLLLIPVFAGFAAGGSDQDSGAQTVVGSGDVPTVKIFLATSRNETEFSDEVKEEILNLTGVNIEYLRAPVDHWKQKLTLALSSGDIYDIMNMDVPTYFQYAVEGVFHDLTDVVAGYPHLRNYIGDGEAARMSVDGKLYCLPNKNVPGKYNLYFRGDWLDTLGLSEPVSLDEYREVMRAFTEDDPDGNGQSDTYGYGNDDFQPFYGAYGVFPTYYTEVDGKISTNSISEAYKQSLMFLNGMWESGYIDPEVFIMESEQYVQKFVNSQVGSLTEWWHWKGSWIRDYAFQELNPNGKIIFPPLPVGPEGYSGVQGRDYIMGAITIHDKSENKEAALNLLDFYASDYGYRVAKYGVEGVTWTQKNNELDYLYQMNNSLDLKGRTNKYDEAFSLVQRMDIYKEQLFGETDSQKGYYEGFEVAAEMNPLIHNMFIGLTTDSFVSKMPDIEAYETEMRIKFIIGETSFDDWDSYVQGWKELGGDEVRQSLLQEYNTQYNTNFHFLE